MIVALDTSFLASLYFVERFTHEAKLAVRELADAPLLSPLNELEFVNAVHLRVFRRELNPRQADAAKERFRQDLTEGLFEVMPWPEAAFGLAAKLAQQSSALGTRTLDILHVAAALRAGADAFWTFDGRQGRLAKAAGLKTLR